MREGMRGWQGEHNKSVSRGEASVSHVSDGVPINETLGERVDSTGPWRQKEEIGDAHAKSTAREFGCKAPRTGSSNLLSH